MASINEVIDQIEKKHKIRDELFEYHYQNGCWGNVSKYDASLTFSTQMQNNSEKVMLVGAYLSEYNRKHPDYLSPKHIARQLRHAPDFFKYGALAGLISSPIVYNDVSVQHMIIGAAYGTVAIGGIYSIGTWFKMIWDNT